MSLESNGANRNRALTPIALSPNALVERYLEILRELVLAEEKR